MQVLKIMKKKHYLEIISNDLEFFFTKEVESALQQLKQNKAIDSQLNNCYFFFHTWKNTSMSILSELFNKLFTCVYFPSTWSEGLILSQQGSIDKAIEV